MPFKINNIPYKFFFLTLLFISLYSCNKNIGKISNETSASTTTLSNHNAEIINWQENLNKEYQEKNTSPLSEKQIELFKEMGGHPFYKIDEKFKVEADFDRNVDDKNIEFQTSSDQVAVYDLFGIASFNLNGKDYKLNVYQSHRMRMMPQYRDHLFLPFTDLTNGEETYGGGRYVDLKIQKGDKLTIDFNKAYSPYCAFSPNYSCPIPPRQNHIDSHIKAGVMYAESLEY